MSFQKSLDITQNSASLPIATEGVTILDSAAIPTFNNADVAGLLNKKEQLKSFTAQLAALVIECQSEHSHEKNAQLFLQRILTSIDRLNAILDVFFEPGELALHGLNRVRLRHDAGNSVNQIVGYTEMLQEDAEEVGAWKFSCDLQQIQTKVCDLLELVNEVSGKVRPQTGALFIED